MQIILNEEIPIPFVTVASSFQIRWTYIDWHVLFYVQ